ncbi:MAG: EamA-like transporter family protein [Phormidesmis sp.]
MTPQELGLLLLSVVTAACGQLLLKLGALKLAVIEASGLIDKVYAVVTIPELIAGLGAYGGSAIAYILLLTRVKLSVAAPSTALIYIFSVLIGIFVFKEPVSSLRLVGLAFIACGVVLVVSQ